MENNSSTATLILFCPDQKGLVADEFLDKWEIKYISNISAGNIGAITAKN